MALYKKGETGNPHGRPKGSLDWRTKLRKQLEADAPALIAKAVELATDGDTGALRLCLERILPPVKARDTAISLPALQRAAGLTNKAEALLDAVAQGDIAPDQAATLMSTLTAHARIFEIDELEQRVAEMETAVARQAKT